MIPSDQESLISGRSGPHSCLEPIAFYLMSQFLPFLSYILLIIFNQETPVVFTITIFLLSLGFWLVKNVHGIQLVGLRWKINMSGFDYYSRPDPFVPQSDDSNAFWVGFFVFAVLWLFAFFISLFITSFLSAVVCLIGAFIEVFNLRMFMRTHKTAKMTAEHAALEILQEQEPANFEFVEDTEIIRSQEPPSEERVITKILPKIPKVPTNVNDAPKPEENIADTIPIESTNQTTSVDKNEGTADDNSKIDSDDHQKLADSQQDGGDVPTILDLDESKEPAKEEDDGNSKEEETFY